MSERRVKFTVHLDVDRDAAAALDVLYDEDGTEWDHLMAAVRSELGRTASTLVPEHLMPTVIVFGPEHQ